MVKQVERKHEHKHKHVEEEEKEEEEVVSEEDDEDEAASEQSEDMEDEEDDSDDVVAESSGSSSDESEEGEIEAKDEAVKHTRNYHPLTLARRRARLYQKNRCALNRFAQFKRYVLRKCADSCAFVGKKKITMRKDNILLLLWAAETYAHRAALGALKVMRCGKQSHEKLSAKHIDASIELQRM